MFFLEGFLERLNFKSKRGDQMMNQNVDVLNFFMKTKKKNKIA